MGEALYDLEHLFFLCMYVGLSISDLFFHYIYVQTP
jgi:hypothetical protein